MDLIDRQRAIKGKMNLLVRCDDDKLRFKDVVPVEYLQNMPSAEPIRCKDCYYCVSYKSFDKTYYQCDAFEAHAEGDLIGVSLQVAPDHYCSWAERRTNE